MIELVRFMSACIIILLVFIFLLVYFMPSIIAYHNKRKNKSAILILNLFLGFTFIGWVIALVWSVMENKDGN